MFYSTDRKKREVDGTFVVQRTGENLQTLWNRYNKMEK
jgi:hypothetical protein